jgi:SnoaL-like domain
LEASAIVSTPMIKVVLSRDSTASPVTRRMRRAEPEVLRFATVDEPVQLLLDRLEIDDLLIRYATAIDARDWEQLDSVFAADAHLDYRSAGGIAGTFAEVRQWLSEVLPIFTWTQHLVVNRAVEIDPSGTTARSRSIFHNPNQMLVEGEPWLFTVGGYYHDKLQKEPAGWRITTRVEETVWWDHPMPGLPATPFPLPDDARL